MYHLEDRYLRPKKAQWLRRMYNTPFPCREDLQIWRGDHATILPLREIPNEGVLFGRGGVVDKEGNYVPLSGIENRIMRDYPVENPVYRDEKVVYCGYLVNHWGHFLVEAVARLWYALKSDDTVDKYVFFLDEGESREIKGNYRRFFQLLNIWDKLELISVPTTYREVIVPEIAFQCMSWYSPKFLEIFDAVARNITVDPQWPQPEKIFFTRSQFAKGNHFDFGTEGLDNYFQRNGYLVTPPEILSLDQMIHYIRGAKEVATISGSGHHNMLFGRNGQNLTIIERFVINDDHQVGINQMRELNVTSIDANYHLYTVDTVGPLIVGYNHWLEDFTRDRGMLPPDSCYASEKYRNRCFKQYMASYRDNYCYRWHMEPWYPEIADSLYEAYEDNYPYFKAYLDRSRPIFPEQYFQLHYIKQFIKRLIGRS